ncbi:MAG: hypothetical protein AAFX94_03555, partial [Myxococcota bacterium]
LLTSAALFTLSGVSQAHAGIKHRKVLKQLKAHAKQAGKRINKEFGTKFRWSYDWKIVGEEVGNWNLTDDQLKKMFDTMAVTPIETALKKLMQDEDYAAAIKDQVKTFKWVAEVSSSVSYSFDDGTVIMKGSLRPDYDQEKPHFASDLARVLENSLD